MSGAQERQNGWDLLKYRADVLIRLPTHPNLWSEELFPLNCSTLNAQSPPSLPSNHRTRIRVLWI